MEDLKLKLLSERFSYHRHLVDRRWQIFGSFLLLDSFFFNSLEKIENNRTVSGVWVYLGVIMASVGFLRILSYTRGRIYENGRRLNECAGEEIIRTERQEKFYFGLTNTLYVTMIAMTMPWFVALYSRGICVFLVVAAAYASFLTRIRWRRPR